MTLSGFSLQLFSSPLRRSRSALPPTLRAGVGWVTLVCAANALAASTELSDVPRGEGVGSTDVVPVPVPAPAPIPIEHSVFFPPAALPSQGEQALSAAQLVQLTVLYNASTAAARLQAQAAGQLLQSERALYEPVGFARLRREGYDRPRTYEERTVSLTNIDKASAIEQVLSSAAGLRGKLPSGAAFELSHELKARNSNLLATTSEREYRGTLTLRLKQPLARGAGRDATEADLQVAEKEQQIEQQRFVKQLLDTVGEAAGTYWQLYRSGQVLALRERALRTAQQLRDETQRRVQGGFGPRVDLLEADVAVGGREADLVRARQQAMESQVRVRNLLNLDGAQTSGLSFSATDLPSGGPANDDAAAEGPPPQLLDFWPSYRIARLRHEQEELRLRFARNLEKPDVSVELGYNTNSLTNQLRTGLDYSLRDLHPGWSIGLTFEMPLGNQGARSKRAAQSLKRDAARLQMEAEAHQVSNEWSTRASQARSSWREMDLLRQEVTSREAIFSAERSSYELGRVRLRQLLETEDRLDESRLRLLEAHVRAQISELSLQALSGQMFQSFGLRLQQ